MKQNRTLIILVALLGIVLIVGALQSVLLNRPTITPDSEAANINRIFEDWGPENVYAVQIYDPVAQASLTINRTNEDLWQLVEFNNLLTQEDGELTAASVAYFPYVSILEAIETERYEEFGLTSDDLTMLVSIILKDGSEHSVAVGDLTASSDSFYALVDDRPNLYVVEAGPVSFFTVLLRRAYAD